MEEHNSGPWFDKFGALVRKLPDACISEVAQSGDNGPAVEKWVEELDFATGLDQDLARGHILEYGAHDLLEVVSMSDPDVAKWVLWNVCWDLMDAEGDDPVVGMVDSRRLSQFLNERVCKPWGYENGFNEKTAKAFAEAKRVHEKLVELHPDEHHESACDTIRGDHHRWCSCGFSYKWDSSD